MGFNFGKTHHLHDSNETEAKLDQNSVFTTGLMNLFIRCTSPYILRLSHIFITQNCYDISFVFLAKKCV